MSCFPPYKGAASCTLYFLLDLHFYLIGDSLRDRAYIDPLWFCSPCFPGASLVVRSLSTVCVTFQNMHVKIETCTRSFCFCPQTHSYIVDHVSLHYNQQISLLSGASRMGWRVQSNLSVCDMKVAINLYLCKSKQYHFIVWLMLVWPPSLPEHLVFLSLPPPRGPV